ncbi:hypothetical protein ACIRP0_31495 [Streptomyces sp. NPDC101733]|uniref:hypothetical protein n=1 Tax=unclassified Streptomyces TaxID=2593676 RepID=UPI0038271141
MEQVTGYHTLIKGSTVTVFGPDGAEIASANRRSFGDALVGRVGDTRLVSDGLGDRRFTSFAESAARHHRAVADPGARDRLWVRWEDDGGVAVVYGTVKHDDADRRATKAGNLYWSGQRQGYATGRKWNPATRDRNLAAVLLELSRQGRNVVVLGPGQTPADLAEAPRPPAAPPAEATLVAAPPAAPPVVPAAPVTAAAPEDFTGLSYEELVEAEAAALADPSRGHSVEAQERYRQLRRLHGERLLERVAASPPVAEMTGEDLAAEIEWWPKVLMKAPFHGSDENYRTLERRKKAVNAEEAARSARTILEGPALADLDDAALESAHERLGAAWVGLPGGHELNDPVGERRREIKAERAERRARSYGERPPVGEMPLAELIAESADLDSAVAAQVEQSAYSYSDAVKEARAQRSKAVDAEWHRRGLEEYPDAARAVLGHSISGKITVRIDGSEHSYGYVERQGRRFRALSGWDQRSSIGDFDSAPGAMAALVQRYDQDPETLPRRTWGRERGVMLPVSAHEPLVSWLRGRPSELSREHDRVLGILTHYQLPTQQKVINPLTNQVMRAYPFTVEEGLLGELARVAERTTEDLREQSLNDSLPKREREAAKRRIPAMGAALIGINARIEQVKAAGGDVERRGVDSSRLAAQMAALDGSVEANDEGGETDGGDESVRGAAAQALGGVPAAGVGGDAGLGPVFPEAGDAGERGDRHGGGGPGGGAGAGDGLRGQGRSAAADHGDGPGAGAARDAASAGGRGGRERADESGSGGTGGDPQGAGEPVAGRFRPDPADLAIGAMARAEANLEAIKTLRVLEGERRGATAEEKRVLARWSGWGSVPVVFLTEPDPEEPTYQPGGDRDGGFEADHARWESYSRVRGELKELLDPFEWRAASRAVLSAHYTPQQIAEAMWQGLSAYGFDGGEVLEAGCGSGVFFGVAPETARLTGVELDPTTAAITARIYPHANVLPESFADTDAPAGTFDLAIGNVPFAHRTSFGERRYGADGHTLHNGFIIKKLALLRPGGYMAVITSRWTLDGEDTKARRDMARWGDLAGAYRLPKGTFGETADTDVVVDVLVFRRRAEGEEPGDQTWIDAPERDLGGHRLHVNSYFTQNPDHVLGRLTSEMGQFGPRVTVLGDPGTAPRMLRESMETAAAAAITAGQGYTPHEDGADRPPLLLQTARDRHAGDFTGRLYTDDQARIWQHANGADPVRVVTADGAAGIEQLRMLMSLRGTAGELRGLDRTGDDPARASEVRTALARLHTAYTGRYGPLSRPRQTQMAQPTDEARAAARAAGVPLEDDGRLHTGWGWFRQDPHSGLVLGLERWDRANDRAVPSEVLTRRPGARRGDLEPTDDPKTALTAVMGATGGVDLPLIASLLKTTPEEARRRLGTEVFDNPVTGKLEHAGAYLSGAVRQKLDQAREAAASDPKYAVNAAALEAAQPPAKRLGQFTAQLGAHWIPAPLVQGFLREYLGDPTLQISHNERYGWTLAAGKVPDAINALKGTERRSAVHIAKALLGKASMVVNDLGGDGVDEDATRAMRYKADAMRSAFEEYCTASTARVTVLTDAYNRQMNGHVVRTYDGLAPTLEGFTTERTPHPWQLSGAARMQFERGVVLAHEVGLGKTTTMVMGSQALKASGQIAKPYAVVQPHLARQWLDEAQLLYPNADIRLITSDDLAGENRRPVLEWLRSNTPDLVIFTEGAFQSIRMSPEQQELYLFRELETLKEQLERERGVPHNAFALMKLEQRLTTVESRIRRNDAPMRNPGEVYWDDLGFDYACIDEAHRFTAIGFRSKEAGGETASVRAVDLHQKIDWQHREADLVGGRPTVTLGTGTPMENSIFEQYSVLELAAPWLLDQFGVRGPDLWAETFGQRVQRIEMAPDGSGLTVVERFSRFVSKSTMKTMWGLAADTKTGDEVGIERPVLAGGAPQLVLVEPTVDQRSRLQTLVARGQAIHAGDVTREEDNMLAVTGEGRAVALDPRLVDANAPAANKLVTAADIIAAEYHAHKDHTYNVSSRDDTPHPVPGGLFFVFCNSGTPGGKNKGNFNAYAELRDLLAARDVPRDLVQFAQDNATPEKKAAMAEAANNGGIAVLMGSTEVLGTGFNGQNRAHSLMHIDQDWTPASMIQRNGRVIRPGNQHEAVNIFFLATKGSMDAWQVGLLTSKAEGLRDIQRPPGIGDDDGDTVEEIGGSDWDYATMAAEIGGNPYMREFMLAKGHLQGLEADRRNLAADRVRQAELLLVKETELAATAAAVAARDTALPKITATTRGDDFHIRLGGRDFDRRGEAGPVLRQAVMTALRGHSTLGTGPWAKLGTFGGLDVAVRVEILDGGAEIRAHVGFPDLRHSESVCSIGDLANPKFGATLIGRLATALEKAEDQQLMDHERLPVLDAEITVLAAQQAAVDYGPAIEHARRRVELLDAVVGAITERDKLPELTESMLDPKTHHTPESRQKAVRERAEQRAPHQAKVDQAAAAFTLYDVTIPAFELATAPTPTAASEPAVPRPSDGSVDPAATGHESGRPAASAADSRAEGPTAQTPEPDGDGHGTMNLFEEFGLNPPARVPTAPEDPVESGDPEAIPEGQMTLEESGPTIEAIAPKAPAPAQASVISEAGQASPDIDQSKVPEQQPDQRGPDEPAPVDNTSTPLVALMADDGEGRLLPVIADEFSILYAASNDLMAARQSSDGAWDTTRVLLGQTDEQAGVLADTDTVERLMAAGLLEYGAMMVVDITPAGRQRIGALASAGRDEPAVGDRVLLVSTGSVGIVGGYRTNERGEKTAEVVFESKRWPNGWDLTVSPLYLTTTEPAALAPEEAAELYRVAALRQVPGTLTDPVLRAQALQAFTPAALASPDVKRAAREEHPDDFVPALASWMYGWATQQWGNVPPDGQPAWVRAFFREGDDAVGDLNGLYIEVADTVSAPLRRAEPDTRNEASRQAPANTTPQPTNQQLDLFAKESTPEPRTQADSDEPARPGPGVTPPARVRPSVAERPTVTPPPTEGQAEPSPAPVAVTHPPATVDADPAEPNREEPAGAEGPTPALSTHEAPVPSAPETTPHPVDEQSAPQVSPIDPNQREPENVPQPSVSRPGSDLPGHTTAPQTMSPPVTAHDPKEVPTMATPTDQATDPAAAPQRGPGREPMPLWDGTDRPVPPTVPEARPAPVSTASGPAPTPEDLYWAEFDKALEAWDELGLPGQAAEVRAAVAEDLAVLAPQPPATPPAASASPATPPAPWAPPSEPTLDTAPPVPAAAAAVEEALTAVDSHAGSLKSEPELQEIRTIRGALANVWDVLKEKAGPAWSSLTNDVRFQGFWKTLSIRACEAISEQATKLADRLRPDLPSAEALLKLSDATLTYSTAAAAQPAPTSAPVPEQPKTAAISEEPSMQRLAERTSPTAYATRDDSARAAEEVTGRFQNWINSPMGQELAASSHRRVTDFREAWQQLPPHDSGPGPAVGPYGDVAERAKALVTAAVGSARFAPDDLKALQALAQAADNHAARLAVTLPPGIAAPAQKAAAPMPRVAVPAPSAARTPRASA